MMRTIRILMVEDSAADVVLTKRAFAKAKIANEMDVVRNGAEALSFLRKEAPFEEAQRPGLILLDLNMPVMGGHEFLNLMKADPLLRAIPVVVLTTSQADSDVKRAYMNSCSAYITKPVTFDKMTDVVSAIGHFWFQIVQLPEG